MHRLKFEMQAAKSGGVLLVGESVSILHDASFLDGLTLSCI